MSLVDDTITRLASEVSALAGAIEKVADLAELVARNALPQKPVAAFVLHAGLDAAPGDTITGLHRQGVSEVIAVVLVVQSLGDPKGQRATATLDTLRPAVIAALAGWLPSGAMGAMNLRRGRLVSLAGGTAFYQLDFACASQLRITT